METTAIMKRNTTRKNRTPGPCLLNIFPKPRRTNHRRERTVALIALLSVLGRVTWDVVALELESAPDTTTETAEVEIVIPGEGVGRADIVPVTTPAPLTVTKQQTEAITTRFELNAVERDIVERVVMAEAEGETYAGQMLVAQCILTACEKHDIQPSAVVIKYGYTTRRPDPSQSVRDAVSAVFDRGEYIVEEPVLYFYNPALVCSDFHESQTFVIEVGGHKFFAERNPE